MWSPGSTEQLGVFRKGRRSRDPGGRDKWALSQEWISNDCHLGAVPLLGASGTAASLRQGSGRHLINSPAGLCLGGG